MTADASLIAALELLVNAHALQRPPTDAEWRTAIGALAQAKGQTERKEKESHGG